MSDEMVTIQVDGKSIQAAKGSMLIEATDNAGIKIPRFCYHEKLSVAANCRMCLVEVDKVPKPLPACATPVMDGMVVHTKSPRAITAQKGTMEFLLINHPLDCPICDQGGECELQDVSLGYGGFDSRYVETKRVVKQKDLGSLVATDMTRCIHCTRCVRFGDEIAGSRELGATSRGEHTEIGTYIQKHLDSELSGNVIDICPVGALTSKPFRYNARAWEMSQKETIASHDCVGSNLSLHVRRNEVLRAVPKNNDAVNECWISDRDRFSYEGLTQSRLQEPMIKQDDKWVAVSWDEALEFVASELLSRTKNDAAATGMLMSPSSTIEEGFLLQKLARALGVENVDYRLRQSDFSETQTPWLGQSIADLSVNNATLLIESNVRVDQPMLCHRVRQSALGGGEVMSLSSVGYQMNFSMHESCVVAPQRITEELAGIAKVLSNLSEGSVCDELVSLYPGIEPSPSAIKIAKSLFDGATSAVLLGSMATSHPDYGLIQSLSVEIARLAGANVGVISHGANSVGLNLMNMLPKKELASAKSFGDMQSEGMKNVVVYNFEPVYDTYDAQTCLAMLRSAEFVVEFAMFENDAQKDYANVLLPITPNTETSGTFVNCEGVWQSFTGAVKPFANSRPGWKVLRVLGNLHNLEGFDYMDSSEVLAECKAHASELAGISASGQWQRQLDSSAGVARIGSVSPYAVDSVVRRAAALQKTSLAENGVVRLSPELASSLGVQSGQRVNISQGDETIELSVVTDHSVAQDSAVVPSDVVVSGVLGSLYGEIALQK